MRYHRAPADAEAGGSNRPGAVPRAAGGASLDLSIAIVCRNNQGTIGRTLESVRGLDAQIVAVDSGSTDGTIELLEQHGAQVERSAWLGFVRTKQLALELCARSWVLALDSDESLDDRLAASVAEVVRNAGANVDSGRLNRVVYYRGSPLRHVWQPEWRRRLVRRGTHRWAGLDPHDRLEPTAPAARGAGWEVALQGELVHDSIGTFADFLGKQARHARTMARSMRAQGKRGSYLRLVGSPVGAAFKQLVLKRAFLDGRAGVLASACVAAGTLMKHAMLIEMERWGDESGGA